MKSYPVAFHYSTCVAFFHGSNDLFRGFVKTLHNIDPNLHATKDIGKICRQANKTPHMQGFWWEFCCDSPPIVIHATHV